MRLAALVLGSSLLLGLPARADPSVQVKGTVRAGEATRVTVRFPDSKSPIRGVAALGSVGAFTQTAPGTFEADFDAPPNCGPTKVVLAVFEDQPGGQVATGVVNIEDTATAKLKVKTHEAVFVRSGSNRSGPFHPNANGEISLAFVANGDSGDAQLETAQGKPLATVPVKVRRADLVLFVRPQRVRPGEQAPAEAVLATSTPARLTGLRASASAGKLSPDPAGVQNGVERFRFIAPPKASTDIDVKVADASGKEVASGQFALAGPRVDQILFKAPSKTLGAGELVQLTISLRDKDGRPTDGDLTLETDSGTLIAPLQMAPGLYTSSFTAPGVLPPGELAHVKAHAVNSELDVPATSGVEIPLHGSKPDHVVIAAIPSLKAGEKAEVTFQVLDKAGNPATAEHLDLAADKGQISDVRRAPDGNGYVATYTAPDDAASHVTLEAHDGPLRLDGEQQFEVTAAPDSEPFLIVGPALGFTSNLGDVSTASIAAEGAFRLPYDLSVGFLAGYLPSTTTTLASTDQPNATGKASFTRIPLHARVGGLYLSGPFEVQAGIELGPTDISGQLTAEGRTASLSGWHFEYGAYVGGGYRLGPGFLAVEVRGSQSKIAVNQNDLQVTGSIGGVNAELSYLFAI